MFGDIQSFFTTTLAGLAIAILFLVAGTKMTPLIANGLLAIAWLILVVSFYRTPHVSNALPILASLYMLGFASAIGLAIYFTLWTKIDDAPLQLHARSMDIEHPGGVEVDGIRWSNKFADLRIEINNPTKFDYQNIDLSIVPDAAITAATQASKLQGVNIWRIDPADITTMGGNSSTGERVNLPYVTIATTVGYRLRCELLPSQTYIQLIFAAVNVQVGNPDINSPDHILRFDFSKGPKVWLAHKNYTDSVFGPRPIVHSVKIAGRYMVQQREHSVNTILEAVDYWKELHK